MDGSIRTGNVGANFMGITRDEIKKVVLAEDDFGHEMRVEGILRSVKPAGSFNPSRISPPSHGGTYKDPVTKKPRQFDFRFRIASGLPKPSRNLLLALECKNLNPDFPLVVCGRPRSRDESYHVFLQGAPQEYASARIVQGAGSIYKPNDFVGKSSFRLKQKQGSLCKDSDAEIYDRWTQAVASCNDLCLEAANRVPLENISTFVMPIVVIPDNALWIASYDESGQLSADPMQVEKCDYYVDHRIEMNFSFVLTHIHFMTLKALSQMLSEFADGDFWQWDRIFDGGSEFIPGRL